MTFNVNGIAVLVAALAGFVVSGLWYSPLILGKQYMKEIGRTMADAKAWSKTHSMAGAYLQGILAMLVMTYVLAYVLGFTQAALPADAARDAFWVWLGFVAPVTASMVTWEGKSWKWWGIINGQNLVALVVSALILVLWK